MSNHLAIALAEWNSERPAWKPVLTYAQLTPAQQSEVEAKAEALNSVPTCPHLWYDVPVELPQSKKE